MRQPVAYGKMRLPTKSESVTDLTIQPPRGAFQAEVAVPGDKSLSHRALILSGMAEGESSVSGLGPGADVSSTLSVLQTLGVEFSGDTVWSPGIAGWKPPGGPLDCGNSGTSLRLLAGALAGRPFASTLTGDASLRSRPMQRLVDPLSALGATVGLSEEETAPVTVSASQPLIGADVVVPLASAQVRTAFALAALQAQGSSTVTSPPGYRDHTERWLEALGLGERTEGTTFRIDPGPVPTARYQVPGDPSSAAYLWAAAAISRGSTVTTPGIVLNPGRMGFLQVLEQFGAVIEADVTGSILGDAVGTVTVRGQGLFAAEVTGSVSVATLDELPLVAVLGALGEGITVVRDAAELRAKESDRIMSTVEMIRALGGGAEPTAGGFEVVGTGWLEPGTVDSHGDHRIAMAAAVAATGATGPITITGADVAAVSWPGFYEQLEAAWSSR